MTRQDTDWTFDGTWPYQPRWLSTPDGRLHYVDEGDRQAPPIVLLHGNPTWAYLYRNFIPALVAGGYRVIVPDFLGFGRSHKPSDRSLYTAFRHVQRLSLLLDSLDLHNVTVLGQDWGGPLGFAWAGSHPDRIAALVVLNTFCHRPTAPVRLMAALRVFRTPIAGELAIKGAHAFVRGWLFRAGVMHRDRLTSSVRRAYLAPHPSWSSRTAILEFPRQLPDGPQAPISQWLGDVHDRLVALADRPVLIVWAGQDPAFTPQMLEDLWLPDFPDAQLLRLPVAGHYLQEDAHELIVPRLLKFLDSNNGTQQ
jgi:pimeloyl-ACP methyl ester carboxylesterase